MAQATGYLKLRRLDTARLPILIINLVKPISMMNYLGNALSSLVNTVPERWHYVLAKIYLRVMM